MASKKDVLDDLDFSSDRISTQVRTIGLSVIAVAWLFLVGGKDTPVLRVLPSHTLLLVAGGLSLLALLFDYFQYVAGYVNNKQVLASGERENSDDFKYDYASFMWKFRTKCFWLKQLFVVSGFVCL